MKIVSEPTPSKSERLKLEIQAYLQSPDIFDKVRIKGEICSFYRISSFDFNLLCQALEKQNSTPQANTFGFDEFINQGTDALEWVIPGILPKGETVLLAALAKTGKTLLATDIAYAVLSGEKAIGETPGVKGRVLLISSDESANSTRRRLRARGFDLLPEANNLRIMTHLDITDLSPLEKELEDFRPHLVVIDSLTSITRDSGVSEKDAEFAKPIYKMKEMLSRYGAAGILIHHLNKDKEAKGINKVSGSARIVAAVWGVWQMMATDPNNDKNLTRWLKVKPREGESTTLTLDINPKDLWASQGIFSFIGEFGDESGEKRTQGERVMELLQKFSPRGLEYQEIDLYLNVGKSLYTVLDRLEDRQLITKRRSLTDARRWVYCLPEHTTEEMNTTIANCELVIDNCSDTPPPIFFLVGLS
ncbi:MAG: AAA family ATPase [Hydrococcus sp. RM1_1_31]|nr:AAA family ATPase [Hydrococcus sp. RM1_1_31]